MPPEVAILFTVALLFVGVATTFHLREQRERQARIALIEYLGIVSEYNDRRMSGPYRLGLVEHHLLQQMRLMARRGIMIVDGLLEHGAITYAKRDAACVVFRELERVHWRTHMPSRLPDLEIQCCGDSHASSCERQWRAFVTDFHLLHRYATHTYDLAFGKFYSTPGSAWQQK